MVDVIERTDVQNDSALEVIDVGSKGVSMERSGVNDRGALILPSPEQLNTLKSFGEMYVQSGLLPAGLKSWQAVAVTIQHGMDLGIPISTALQQIYVINGKPTCSASLMASLIYRDHGDDALQLVESTDKTCTYSYKRRSWPELARYTYTIEDAERAKLTAKDTWKQFPKSMLRARCIADVAHANFQDTIGGLYLRDEIESVPTISPVGGDASAISHATADALEASGNVIEGSIAERADKELIKDIAAAAEQLGMTKEQLQFMCGKPGKDLTPNEANQIYSDLLNELDERNAKQANPTTGELPGVAPDPAATAARFRD
jgi:hypothetical protein